MSENICSSNVRVEHMFERSRSWQSCTNLGHHSHFEHLSDETYETVERTNLQTDLALEFPAMECFNLCNC